MGLFQCNLTGDGVAKPLAMAGSLGLGQVTSLKTRPPLDPATGSWHTKPAPFAPTSLLSCFPYFPVTASAKPKQKRGGRMCQKSGASHLLLLSLNSSFWSLRAPALQG